MARKVKHTKSKSVSKDLLKLGALDGERAKASEGNMDSSLLSLAPEIRNNIYGHVLGGHKVHFFTEWVRDKPTPRSVLRYHICGSGKLATNPPKKRLRPKIRRACGCYCSAEFDLSFLRTCRQIYDDAALIPYASNNFLVSTSTFTLFMNSLLDAQKASIKHITMIGQWGFTQPASILNLKDVRGLTSLKHLSVVVTYGLGQRPFQGLMNLAALPDLQKVSFDFKQKLLAAPQFPTNRGRPLPSSSYPPANEFREYLLRPSTEFEEERKMALRKKAKEKAKKEEAARLASEENRHAVRSQMGLRSFKQ
ncbi:hypothetical protein CERZMDRAFT_104756 [Cercospora zeae-maydis SCOH1-5]|uniref:DUF7730 domain-containing protein n=1 Tax=Cercospora zeae-maydis SCOH1-5 TaxID=717836 RepID=A0A6A6FSQ1_9PEZI|nr:hypothetical protein CERZMDRAFT_104756 [Cercospora zeae-maydis SCOH1-5]